MLGHAGADVTARARDCADPAHAASVLSTWWSTIMRRRAHRSGTLPPPPPTRPRPRGTSPSVIILLEWRNGATYRERVQAELVPITADVVRSKAGAHKHRPQIARIVVALVIVHLDCRAETEPEGGQL